jgi:cytochrome c oxidase cbb3-type subunit 1
MAVHPYYVIRMLGGLMFLIGALLMVYNLIQTVRSRSTEPVFALPSALAVAGE